jgi:DNA-binding transcriptional regulator YhcF (GntR family)
MEVGFKISIDSSSDIPKYRQIIDSVNNAISRDMLHAGDFLPSVNQVCSDYKLSRDTVFKAYSQLKEQGVIESVPNKGYFVAQTMRKVFVFLDTFKAYKEVLYDSFVKNLPRNIIADVNFHHYNIQVFRKLIQESIGKYTKYIVMPFDDAEMAEILGLLPSDKLLVIDWNIHSGCTPNKLYQDFGKPVYSGLESILHLLKKYDEAVFLYPEFTKHPYESVEYFKRFCRDKHIKHSVLTLADDFDVKRGKAYFCVSDRMLGRFLTQCREKKLEPGIDTGIVSYNETPMKQFIYKGITVISTEFQTLGKKAAEFVVNDSPMNICVPTKVIIRESL